MGEYARVCGFVMCGVCLFALFAFVCVCMFVVFVVFLFVCSCSVCVRI